jgi:hypothetical protein
VYTISPRRHGAITAWLAGTEVALYDRDGRPTSPAEGDGFRSRPDSG